MKDLGVCHPTVCQEQVLTGLAKVLQTGNMEDFEQYLFEDSWFICDCSFVGAGLEHVKDIIGHYVGALNYNPNTRLCSIGGLPEAEDFDLPIFKVGTPCLVVYDDGEVPQVDCLVFVEIEEDKISNLLWINDDSQLYVLNF